MADYIYMMESRLTPEQQRGVVLVQEAARAHELNLYLTGGTIRDIISGLMIRDLDFTLQGNALRLQRDLEKAGAVIEGVDEELKSMFVQLPGNVRAEVAMARSEKFGKPGEPPEIAPATIIEDLRRRDFTVNAMALSLNPGSRGLLLDPFNGTADIEAKLLRILHSYSFLEDPSRLIRATRFAARFHWTLEERTQARYLAAKENEYIKHVSERALGQEIEQLAYEDDAMLVRRALDREDWLKVLHPRWTLARVDAQGLASLLKTRQVMNTLGYSPDSSAATMYFLARRLPARDITAVQKRIPRQALVEAWRSLEVEARGLSKLLTSKEAATPSKTWHLLSAARPETILFLEVTARQKAVVQKLRNFLGKWRQIRERKLPFPEMAELHITPALPAYPKLMEQAFLLLLDGKLRSHNEILRFLKPFAPPPPPPPPPPKRGRAPKGAPEAAPVVEKPGKGQKKAAEAAKPAPGVKPAAAAKPAVAAKKHAPKSARKKAAKKKPTKKKPTKKKPPKKKLPKKKKRR
jgi:tRNA nucleotidyltransferase/poly(A) polymerase